MSTTTIRDFNVPSGAIIGSYYDNYIHLKGSASGNAVDIAAEGIDDDISITLTPKGSGTVNIPVTGGFTFSNGINNSILYLDSTGVISTTENLLFSGTDLTVSGKVTAARFVPTGSTVPSNGLYLAGTNKLGLSTNSTVALLIDSNGKVGIGQSPTTHRLEVNGDAKINNVSIGLGNSSVISNTVVGNNSLSSNTFGLNNTALGSYALSVNTSGSQNTAIGAETLVSNITGSDNIANGVNALHSNTTGNFNTGIGSNSLYSNLTASGNTAVGFGSAYSTTIGNYNTSVGYGALYSNMSGANNTAFGANALYNSQSGGNNIAIGTNSLYSTTTGRENVSSGVLALNQNTSGSNNVAIGSLSGVGIGIVTNTSGSNNTFIGYQTGATVDGLTNSTAIGNGAQITANNQVVIGNNLVTVTQLNGNVLIGTSINSHSSALMVNGVIETSSGVRFPDGSILTSATPGILTVTSISNTTKTAIDTFGAAAYRSAKYLVQITNSIRYHVIELLLIHDGGTVYLAQYGEIFTNMSLGSFDATITAGSVNLYFTPVYSLTTVKTLRQSLAV
jgi:hypothetical protein